jgi:hypothetical protein
VATTSRPIVQTGIAQFFGGTTYDTEARAYRGNIPAHLAAAGLSTVRAYQSKRVSDNDYVLNQAAGRGMGAYMIVEMPQDVEIRRALPAGTGRKRITYTVVLHIFHLAHMKHAEDAEADVAALLEEIKAQIRSDVTLGMKAQGLYQAGENPSGIRTRVLPSVQDKEVFGTMATVTFDAEVEIVS